MPFASLIQRLYALGFNVICRFDLNRKTFEVTAQRVAASFGSLEHLRVEGRHSPGFAPLSGFWRTADGWIRLHANYPHHEQALMRALKATSIPSIRATLASANSIEAETAINAAGGVAAAVKTHEAWLRSDPGETATDGPWLKFLGSGETKPRPTTWRTRTGPTRRPLGGLRVLDLTRVVAGPSASRLLGALGADVLRVDPPALPELINQHIDTGFCKRSVELDLNEPHDLRTFQDLLQDCHVLLLGYRTGALDKFGLTPEKLLEHWPTLKVVSLNAWGFDGSSYHHKGFDSIVQAACGIAHIYRDSYDSPGSLPVQALDHATGMGVVAAVAILLTNDHLTHAQTSLARTAHELMQLPQIRIMEETADSLATPTRELHTSDYGRVEYVPPPLLLEGQSLEYSTGPVKYGSSIPRWEDTLQPTI